MDDTPLYIKSYLAMNTPINFGQLLNINYHGQTYGFHLERLVFRKFDENDYSKYSKKLSTDSECYRIFYYYDGGNALYHEGKLLSCPEGSLIVVPPGLQPSNTPKIKGEYSLVVFVFYFENKDGQVLKIPFHKLLQTLSSHELPPYNMPTKLNTSQQKQIWGIFQHLYMALFTSEHKYSSDLSQGNPYLISASVLQLFSFIESLTNANEIHIPKALQSAIGHIHDNYMNKVDIETLALLAGLSKPHFQHLFKKHMGMTPIQYVTQVRMNQARLLLINTDLSCTQIAEETGFSTPYYFSKQFKKVMGLSPSQFRYNET